MNRHTSSESVIYLAEDGLPRGVRLGEAWQTEWQGPSEYIDVPHWLDANPELDQPAEISAH